MTIEKAAVIAAVRNRTGRGTGLASIDTELLAILVDLSNKVPAATQTSSTVTISAAAVSGTLPASCTKPVSVQGMDIITFPEYLAFKNADSDDAATIKRVAFYGGLIYVHPSPTGATDLTLFHRAEENDIDNISLDDDFFEAVAEGVTWKVWAGLGTDSELQAEAVTHKQLYDEQVGLMSARYKHREL